MLRGSDLAQLRNQIITTAKGVASPKQREYFSLIYEEEVSHDEVAQAYGLAGHGSVRGSLNNLRSALILSKPFLASNAALKYKGAARILKMLAMQCDRKNEAHTESDFSYTRLLSNVEEIVDSNATEIQKATYKKYFLEGKTQVQVAAESRTCQSTVWRTLFGTHDYRANEIYGGIIAKVGKQLNHRNVPYCCHLIEPYGGLFQFVFGK